MTRTIRRALAALAAGAVVLGAASEAQAYVTPTQAQNAADRGAFWFQGLQVESGALDTSFGDPTFPVGDWAMTALATAEISSHDVRYSLGDPSAQDFYAGSYPLWSEYNSATDTERQVLAGSSGGLQTSRLGTTIDGNLEAKLISLVDGAHIGGDVDTLINDDIFGTLALERIDAPQPLIDYAAGFASQQQNPDGGFGYATGADSDTDITGSALAMLCAAGAGPNDPAVQDAIAFVKTFQDNATGGIKSPFFGDEANTNSTGWFVSGLNACGIDPQSAELTTAAGKTPLDYLVSMQLPSGQFKYMGDDPGFGTFATLDSTRALGGESFAPAAPETADGSPAIRPPDITPSEGEEIPISLVIDHGAGVPAGDRIRACSVDVENGSSIDEVLADAQAESSPEGCVGSFATAPSGPGVKVTEVNGGQATEESTWKVQVDNGVDQAEATEPIGFGDLVYVHLAGAPVQVTPPTVIPDPVPAAPPARATIKTSKGGNVKVRGGSVAVKVTCPVGVGADGCRGAVELRHRGKSAGSASFSMPAGETVRVKIDPSRALLKALAEGKTKATVIARTRDADGAISTSKRRVTLG